MKVLKKATAVVVMLLSALLMVVMLAGIYGAWWGQGQAHGAVTEAAAAIDGALKSSQTAVDRANTVVVTAQGRVDQASATITAAGTRVEDTNLALAAAERLLDQDLTPMVEQITQGASDVRDTLTLAESSIRLMRIVPGGRDNRLLNLADEAILKIRNVDQAVQDVRTSISDAKSRVTAEAVGRLTTPLGNVSGRIGQVSADLLNLNQRIDGRRADVIILRDQMLLGITVAAIVLTLAFLWLAFSQVGLFVHAYGVFTGRDPLARWHKAQGGSSSTRA